jgi:hypothetical protein
MEARFGQDFSAVRLHTDAAAARSAIAAGARAYTSQHHIVFGPQRYAPETPEGQRLLAHELAHVVQQRAPKRSSTAAAEQEAAAAASSVAAGEAAPVTSGSPGGIQREELSQDDLRRLAQSNAACPSGRCHGSPAPAARGGKQLGGDFAQLDPQVVRDFLGGGGAAQQPAPAATPPANAEAKTPAKPPPAHATPPGVLRPKPEQQRRNVPVQEFLPTGFFGPNLVLSPKVAGVTNLEQTQPDKSAGYNFDTYLRDARNGRLIPAQHLGGTVYRVFMGTPECPGCHFGQGLVIDLQGEHFLKVFLDVFSTATALNDVAAFAGGRLRPPLRPGEAPAPAPKAPSKSPLAPANDNALLPKAMPRPGRLANDNAPLLRGRPANDVFPELDPRFRSQTPANDVLPPSEPAVQPLPRTGTDNLPVPPPQPTGPARLEGVPGAVKDPHLPGQGRSGQPPTVASKSGNRSSTGEPRGAHQTKGSHKDLEDHQNANTRRSREQDKSDARERAAQAKGNQGRQTRLVSDIGDRIRNFPDRVRRRLSDPQTPDQVKVSIIRENLGEGFNLDEALRENGLNAERLLEALKSLGAL